MVACSIQHLTVYVISADVLSAQVVLGLIELNENGTTRRNWLSWNCGLGIIF